MLRTSAKTMGARNPNRALQKKQCRASMPRASDLTDRKIFCQQRTSQQKWLEGWTDVELGMGAWLWIL